MRQINFNRFYRSPYFIDRSSISALRIFAQNHANSQEEAKDIEKENEFPKPGESYPVTNKF